MNTDTRRNPGQMSWLGRLLSPRSAGVELTADPAFAQRIRRLSLVAIVALGVLFAMWAVITERYVWAGVLLAIAWATMPLVLWWSLMHPLARYALVLPASAAILGMFLAGIFGPPSGALGVAGWWTALAGLAVGGSLGAWLWYRWLPVPDSLDRPFAPARWLLISVHVGLVVAGMALMLVGWWRA